MKIGIRTTVLKDKEGNIIYIPNLLFITNPVKRKNNGKAT